MPMSPPSCRTLSKCIFEHTLNPIYGENLWAGHYLPNADEVLWGWYDNEIDLYPFQNPSFHPSWGHFTAVVWKYSRTLGCDICDGGGRGRYPYIAVCQYNLGGNVNGQFGNNVFKVPVPGAPVLPVCMPSGLLPVRLPVREPHPLPSRLLMPVGFPGVHP